MTEPLVWVGIDVSKAQLDVAVRPSGRAQSVPQSETGLATLVGELRTWRPAAIVLEATGAWNSRWSGRWSRPVCRCMSSIRGRCVSLPGRLAKTDALDAQILAQFAEVLRPAPRPLPDEATQALSALVTRRRQLIEMLTAEKNRRSRAPKRLRERIEIHIDWLTQELTGVDRELTTAIRQSPVWREQDDLLQSLPGVGSVLSRTMLAELPE